MLQAVSPFVTPTCCPVLSRQLKLALPHVTPTSPRRYGFGEIVSVGLAPLIPDAIGATTIRKTDVAASMALTARLCHCNFLWFISQHLRLWQSEEQFEVSTATIYQPVV
jgi:hypothetical protein